MKRYFTKPFPLVFSVVCLFLGSTHSSWAARQPGAPRALPLQFGFETGSTSPFSAEQPAIGGEENPGGARSLYFTRRAGENRNLFRAMLQIRSSEINGEDADARILTSVAPVLAAPLTRLQPPFYAHSAAPLPDGRGLLCVTNALASPAERTAGWNQIARLDIRTGALKALSPADARYATPAVSPDGRIFSYASERNGSSSIWVAPLTGGVARRVALRSRRATWLDDATLLLDSTAFNNAGQGLVRLWLDGRGDAQRLWPIGGSSTALDGRLICAATTAGSSKTIQPTQLVLMGADGSGARALPGTFNASSPVFSPDGSFLVYDAPLTADENRNAAEIDHTLWLVPFRRVAPVARLDTIRPAPGGGFDVIGTAFTGDDAPLASLEWGEGATPTRWNPLPVASLPIHNAPLSRWTPPVPRGEWTLRLSVADADGDKGQSQLPVVLPLAASVNQVAPPIFAASPVAALPLPALPPAPGAPVEPSPSMPRDRAPEGSTPPPPIAPAPIPAPRPVPTPRPVPKPRPALPAPTNGSDAAVVTVSGIPYEVKAGETMSLSASLRNTGRNGWKTNGDSPVRLLVRWHDARTKTRTRWAIRWLRADVAPGATGKLDFSIPAPPRAGEYILRFSLVRTGRDGYTPPPWSQTATERYPGEFGVATTTMPVR
ncbi:MAG TPA: hypothetical protein VF681_01030 [Abditibacteriaceae bacterium]|jgi:hypothetical protein